MASSKLPKMCVVGLDLNLGLITLDTTVLTTSHGAQ